MRTNLRARAVAVFVALAGSILLTMSITSGSAVAFFSGGLFLDVQVESPATLVARGAAVDVPLEITCNATDPVDVFVRVTQRSGSGIAEGFGSTTVGSPDRVSGSSYASPPSAAASPSSKAPLSSKPKSTCNRTSAGSKPTARSSPSPVDTTQPRSGRHRGSHPRWRPTAKIEVSKQPSRTRLNHPGCGGPPDRRDRHWQLPACWRPKEERPQATPTGWRGCLQPRGGPPRPDPAAQGRRHRRPLRRGAP